MVGVTTLPGSSITALKALLVLACAVVFNLALSSILSVGRLRRAYPLTGLYFSYLNSILYADRLKRAGLSTGFPFLVQLVLVRKSPEACRLVHRAYFPRSARSCTQIA